MSNTNRVQLAYIEEESFGGEHVAGNAQILRLRGEGFKQNTAVITSEEIRSDRQIVDVIRTGRSGEGNIDFELSYGTYDELLKSVLMDSDWSVAVNIQAITISAASADNSFNDSGSGFGSFVADEWIQVSGFTNPANNGIFKIVSKTISKLVVAGGILVTEAEGDTVHIKQGERIINGITLDSYAFERKYVDLNSYSSFKGVCLNQLSIDVPADGIIKGSFATIHVGEESTGLSESYDDPTTTEPVTGANHVQNILENMGELAILSTSLTLNNNLRTRLQVGTLGAVGVGTGSVEIGGGLQIYFENHTLFNKYLNQDETSLSLVVEDNDGNIYVIDLPSIKITGGQRVAGGLNTDVIGDFEWKAFMNPDEEITIKIVRFPFA